MTPSLQQLLQRPDIWRKRDHRPAANISRSHTTGFAELDEALHGNGWPRGALTELLMRQPGIGELELLTPTLADLSQRRLLQVWINPPHIPYAPALAQRGLALEELLVVRGEPRHHLWACEQALRSPACGAVLYWPAQSLRYAELRKLQVAAASQQAMAFLFRDSKIAQQTSPAALRLHLESINSQLAIHILKQRGREAGQSVFLSRGHAVQPTQTFTLPKSLSTQPTTQPTTQSAEAPRVILKIVAASGRKLSLHTRAQHSSLHTSSPHSAAQQI